MSKPSKEQNSMMAALRRAKEVGCEGIHQTPDGSWAACGTAEELSRTSKLARSSQIAANEGSRSRRGENKIKKQWETLGQRGIVSIATLDGGGLVSGAVGKQVKPGDLETYSDIRIARQRARQLGCIGVARRYGPKGEEFWTPCTNMSDLSRLAGLTSLGRRRLDEQRVRTVVADLDKRRKRQSGRKDVLGRIWGNKLSVIGGISTKKLSGRIGGGLRVPPAGMVFVDVSGAIDADRDGLVNEGKPDERPIVPARVITQAVADSIGNNQILQDSMGARPLETQSPTDGQSLQTEGAPTPTRSIKSHAALFGLDSSTLKSRLSNDERDFLGRLMRDPGFASEVPDRIVLAGGPELSKKIRAQNIRAHQYGMRSSTSTANIGGRAMSDIIFGRIDEDEFGQPQPVMYFVGGTMGSGKSTSIQTSGADMGIPSPDKSAHIDPDEIKTALPGWDGGRGAGRVHAQSRIVTDKVLARAIESRTHVVIQGTGKRTEHLAQARANGFSTIGHFTWVPPDLSRQRIIDRSAAGGARVEPYLGPLIAGELQEIVHRQISNDMYDEFYLWDTRESPPKLIASLDGAGKVQILDNEAFTSFFGEYGSRAVRRHWDAVSSTKSNVLRSTTTTGTRKETGSKAIGQGVRLTFEGFTPNMPMRRRDVNDVVLARAEMPGATMASGEKFTELDMRYLHFEGGRAAGVTFSGSNLFGSNFSRANLSRATFSSLSSGSRPANLRRAHMSYAHAPYADFTGVDLTGAKLTGANLKGANFRDADLTAVDLRGANLSGANLSNAVVTVKQLSDAILDDETILPESIGEIGRFALPINVPLSARPIRPTFDDGNVRISPIPMAESGGDDIASLGIRYKDGVRMVDGSVGDMTGLSLDRRDLSRVSFNDVNISGSELERSMFLGSKLSTVDLSRSNLSLARFGKSDLRNVKFESSDMFRADFRGANMSAVSFRGANLREANFENLSPGGRIDLRGADLRGAYLAGADLRKAIIDDRTILRGARTDSRTLLPANVDKSRIGATLRSTTRREFDDFLFAEATELEAAKRRPYSQAQAIRSTSLSSQSRYQRAKLVGRALPSLMDGDARNFGAHLTAIQRKNIEQRSMMASSLWTMAEDARAKAMAIESLGLLPSLSGDEVDGYVEASLIGSLADSFRSLVAAAEAERPSGLGSESNSIAFAAARNQKIADGDVSALMRLNALNASEAASRRRRRPSATDNRQLLSLLSPGGRMEGLRSSSRAQQIYDETAKSLIDALEQADANGWERPWRLGDGVAKNALTGAHYKGGNVLWLNIMQYHKGYSRPVWATYKQWEKLGAQVRRGQKGTIAVKFTQTLREVDKPDGSKDVRTFLAANAFTLFNIDQVDGIDPSQFDLEQLSETERMERLESVVDELTGAGIRVVFNDPDRAYFSPTSDIINLPPFSSFKDARSYYSTLAHEAVHWTGHQRRLNRDNMHRFGSPEYAYEELVAEIGSAMFLALMGLEPVEQDQHAPYIKSWIQLLKDDPTSLRRAISDAQKAVDYLTKMSPTLQRDLNERTSDGEIFDDPTSADVLDVASNELSAIVEEATVKTAQMRSATSSMPSLVFGKPDITPLTPEKLRQISDDRLAYMITDDRMGGLSVDEAAVKYRISRVEVLRYMRKYLSDLEGGRAVDWDRRERTLPIRRNGQLSRIPISDMTEDELNKALVFIQQSIVRAKNDRERRTQQAIESDILTAIDNLSQQRG